MGAKTIFDPRLKLDFINGKVPDEFREILKKHDTSRWRYEKWSRLIGFSYYNNKEFDLRILNNNIIQLEKEVAYLKAKDNVISLVLKKGSNSRDFERILFKNKAEIIEVVEKNKKLFNIKSFSKLLNLNKNTYYEWKQLNKSECKFSKNFICVKRHPNKLSIEEEDKIIELLSDKNYEHYPISSLIWMAKYNNLVHAGRSAWNRIKKENSIERKKIKKTKRKYNKSLLATYSNQYLHADITYYKIEGGKTYFIYLVKDNFSKFIKAWAVSNTINPDTRIETFEIALSDLVENFEFKVTFITDYGNENRAKKVYEYIKSLTNVDLKFARRDIPFSNSMIERFNYDLKYMYLYKERIKSLGELKQLLEIAVKDHNYTKRMEKLNGQTPYEVYNGIPKKTEWILEQWRNSRENRFNKINSYLCCMNK
jgi:transposase InsO family protein